MNNSAIVDSDKLLALRSELDALRALKKLKEENGIFFYEPHWKQHLFHANAHHTGRHARTGNRGGKTKCGCAEDVAFCLGYRPWYTREFDIIDGDGNVREHHPGGEDHPLVTHGIFNRPIKLLLLVADWDKSYELFTNFDENVDFGNRGEYAQLIPKKALKNLVKSRSGHIVRIDIERPAKYGGSYSSIHIDTLESYKHSKLSAESSDWDIIHVDEPCPRDMFIAHKRGLVDRKGKFWINCTPLGHAWIQDEFVPDAANKEDDSSRYMITWTMADNPHNSKEAIQEFLTGLTKAEKEARFNGLPSSLIGLIYQEFVYDMHVLSDVPSGWKSYEDPPANYTIRIWWDFHLVLQQAILFFATAPDGTVYIYDELFDHNLIQPTVDAIKERVTGRNVVSQEIDPLALIPHPTTGESIETTLLESGLCFGPATKDKRRGILKARERFAQRDCYGHPTIYISPNCKKTLSEITRYSTDENGKPIDENDHMMENMYRGILSGLSYIEPATGDYKSEVKEISLYPELAI